MQQFHPCYGDNFGIECPTSSDGAAPSHWCLDTRAQR